jgi:phage regulator Rha-like protein
MSDVVEFLASAKISSLEIAKLTGKKHYHILRDIDNILSDLWITNANFGGSYKDSSGKTNRMYNVDKRVALVLATWYSTKLRAAIIDRWIELETSLIKWELLQKQLETERLENMIDNANLFRRW